MRPECSGRNLSGSCEERDQVVLSSSGCINRGWGEDIKKKKPSRFQISAGGNIGICLSCQEDQNRPEQTSREGIRLGRSRRQEKRLREENRIRSGYNGIS